MLKYGTEVDQMSDKVFETHFKVNLDHKPTGTFV